ncbi:hypothetical protein CAL14_05610 [Bordetella genomosp. 9]|uniref:hypothetical protein n=1 Tax=Bordetella genomosp. 9 TaxID=1416803 RepID=UPI000A294163|nr:hypothetical protein [Bordetella genomosp. 9]ARP89831.1 hypothetical protein CAL14_05610 [Bordetella genomosp. 9]
MHWSDRYLGEPYVPEVGDCASLAARVAREILGIDCGLPEGHATGLWEQSAQVLANKDALAQRVERPIDAQPALFLARGRLAHIGVACLIGPEVWILHADQSAGAVVRERLTAMTKFRYKLEGFYKWL